MKHIKPISKAQGDPLDTLNLIVAILTAVITLIPLINQVLGKEEGAAARGLNA